MFGAWERRLLDLFAVLVIALMLLVCLQVGAGVLGMNPLIEFDARLPLISDAVSIDSLLDAQWHLLATIALLPAALAWRRDTHVRVDFIFARMGARWRASVEVLGHLLLTLPFLVLAIPASWRFTARAFASNEGSSNAGLVDRFLVKGLMPVGLTMLLVVVLVDLGLQLRRLRHRG